MSGLGDLLIGSMIILLKCSALREVMMMRLYHGEAVVLSRDGDDGVVCDGGHEDVVGMKES